MSAQHPRIFDDSSETELILLENSVPKWLNGTLIRNGPGLFNLPGTSLNHWFDGMAVLHKFMFKDGRISYLSKFLQSSAYLSIMKRHKVKYGEFATSPKQSLIANILSLVINKLTDNNNVNIIKFGKNFLAMTETDRHALINPKTLEIINTNTYNDSLKLVVNLAHPLVNNGVLFNIGIKFGQISKYILYQVDLVTHNRNVIAEIPTKSPAYMHTFAKTENHFILYENPLRLRLLKLFFSKKPFIENYVWTDLPGNFIVLNKNGKILAQIKTESFFCFHTVNSFEENGKIYLDLITYPNADIINAFYLEARVNLESKTIIPALNRYIIDMEIFSYTSHKFNLPGIEFPAINNVYAEKSYNFIYAAATKDNAFQLDSLIKIDISNNSYKLWYQDGCFPGEPVFVAKDSSGTEDNGVVISVVADLINRISFILIIDALTFSEISRVNLPHILPLGLHGSFYPE